MLRAQYLTTSGELRFHSVEGTEAEPGFVDADRPLAVVFRRRPREGAVTEIRANRVDVDDGELGVAGGVQFSAGSVAPRLNQEVVPCRVGNYGRVDIASLLVLYSGAKV